MRALTWNVFHGRTVPPSGRSQLAAFAGLLAGWTWDVALLQEVPPWWPEPLARAAGAQSVRVLTSRNSLLGVRRAIASRNPDLLGANGGGCNAILVRGNPVEHRTLRLARLPERRWTHGVRLASGVWAVNLHATARNPERALAECRRAADAWAAHAPLVLGGDLNLRGRPELPGLRHVAGNYVDHIFAAGLEPAGSEVLEHGGLSDHAPVVADLAA